MTETPSSCALPGPDELAMPERETVALPESERFAVVDVVVLTPDEPSAADLAAALAAVGERHPALRVRPRPDLGLLQLVAAQGVALTIEQPRLVCSFGEAERLLGVTRNPPFWWLETQGRYAYLDAQRTFTETLARAANGVAVRC